jgi:hypothetical protein
MCDEALQEIRRKGVPDTSLGLWDKLKTGFPIHNVFRRPI